MSESLASLRQQGGGSGELKHYSTTVTGSGSSIPVPVTGKVVFVYGIGNYNGHVMARTGTDHDALFQYDFTAEYHSDYGIFSQNGNQILFNSGASATLTWSIHYWSEE
jgi:hypothetical protein